jgi:hypothetical protein
LLNLLPSHRYFVSDMCCRSFIHSHFYALHENGASLTYASYQCKSIGA